MPFVRDVAVTEFTSTGTTGGTAEMPDHVADDILLVFQQKDATGAITQTGANYTVLSSGSSTGAYGLVAWRRATTATEPAWVSTWSADSSVMVVVSVGGAHVTNAPTSARDASDDTTIPYTPTAAKTTASANSLVFTSWHADNSQGPTPWPVDHQVIYAGDSGEAGLGIGWTFETTNGASVTGKRFFATTADDGRGIIVTVEDDGDNSPCLAYIDNTSTAPVILHTLGAAITFDGRAWSLPASVTVPVLGRDVGTYFNHDGTTFTDDTTDINDVGTNDVAPTNTTSGVIYFGDSAQWSQMTIAVNTAGTGSPAATWEYSTGSGGWSTLSLSTGTAGDLNFTATGNKTYRFTPPSNWVTDTVNSVSRYWIRRRQTANWTVAATLSQACLDGMGNLFDAIASTADSGCNPYHTSTALSGPAAADTNNVAGGEQLTGTSIDMDPGYFLTRFRFVAPRDGIDCGLFKTTKGVVIGVYDTSNNYKFWTVSAKNATDSSYVEAATIGIQPAQTTDTTWAKKGSLSAGALDTFAFEASSYFGLVDCQFSQLLFVNGVTILSGGSASVPLSFNDINEALVRGCCLFPVVKPLGSAATYYLPLQMGGADPANFEMSLVTFQFPTRASTVEKTGTWHCDDNTVGIEFYGKTDEIRHFTGCTFVSGTPYYWRFNASHAGDSDTDFTGSTVVNATVTLRSTVSLTSVTFNGCPTFTQNSATLDACTFVDTKISCGGPGDLDNITNCSFTSDGTGHAIEVSGSAADLTFTGNTFTDYASVDGSTGNEAIYFNIGSGTINLTIDGGGSVPSIRTAGATVNVIAGAVTVSVHVQTIAGADLQNARVFLKAANGSGPFPFEEVVTIANAGTTATVTHTAHGMATSDQVVISGASHNANNGVFTITKINDNSYSYTMASSPGSNPSGTILATFVALHGLTDVDGNISTTRVYSADQAITGWSRFGSSPYYKPAAISGTVDSDTGFSATALMIDDA